MKRLLKDLIERPWFKLLNAISFSALLLIHFNPVAAQSDFPPPATVPDNSHLRAWIQDTNADWEQGDWINLEDATLSGTLRLVQSRFAPSVPMFPYQEPTTESTPPAIAIDGTGAACAVWHDNPTGIFAVYVSCRQPTGTWSPALRIDPAGLADQKRPVIAMNEAGATCAAWEDYRNGNADLYAACRLPTGGWEPPTRVSDDVLGADTQQRFPAVALNSQGMFCAAWQDNRNGDDDIYAACRRNRNWGPNFRINDDLSSTAQTLPDLALDDSGNAYIVWRDQRPSAPGLYFAVRPPNQNWAANTLISPDLSTSAEPPAIAVDPDATAYVVWTGANLNQLRFASRPAGSGWQPGPEIPSPAQFYAEQHNPDIAVDAAGTVYVIWECFELRPNLGGYIQTFAAWRPAGGTAWTTQQVDPQTPEDRAYQFTPALAVNRAGVGRAIWTYSRGQQLELHSAAKPIGGAWTGAERAQILSRSNRIIQDQLYVTANQAGQAHAAWIEPALPNESEPLNGARRQPDNSWAIASLVPETPYAVCRSSPQTALDEAGNLYVVWEEQFRTFPRNICVLPHPQFAFCPAGGPCQPSTTITAGNWTASPLIPAIAVDGAGGACAVWRSRSSPNEAIVTACRPTSGTWSAPTPIYTTTQTLTHLDIAQDAVGNACVVWEEAGVVQTTCRASGSETWEPPFRLAAFPAGRQSAPRIAGNGPGTFCAIWDEEHDGLDEIFTACRPAAGPWLSPTAASDETAAPKSDPNLLLENSGTLHAAWLDDRTGQRALYFSRRPAGGAWSPNLQVNDDFEIPDPGRPFIIPDSDGRVQVIWQTGYGVAAHAVIARELPAAGYRPRGRYTSPAFDAGATVIWRSLVVSATVPPTTHLALETRSSVPGLPWSPWTPVSTTIFSPPGQQFQYRVTFISEISTTTPVLDRAVLTYRAPQPPPSPRFITPCGLTNQLTPTLTGLTHISNTVTLYSGPALSMTTVADSRGVFTFTPALASGRHILTATARNAVGQGPASLPLTLTVDSARAFDPLGVRAGPWGRNGWRLSYPRDAAGCADPTGGWQVWPRPALPFRVEVPVTAAPSGAVTVTLGAQTITLTEQPDYRFTGQFYPPLQNGPFIITVTAGGRTDVATGTATLTTDGIVYDSRQTITDTLADVSVTCYYSDTHAGLWIPWEAQYFGQANPQRTLDDGTYFFAPPSGIYRLVAEKTGYPFYTSPEIQVTNTPIHYNLPLGRLPYPIYLPSVLRQ